MAQMERRLLTDTERKWFMAQMVKFALLEPKQRPQYKTIAAFFRKHRIRVKETRLREVLDLLDAIGRRIKKEDVARLPSEL